MNVTIIGAGNMARAIGTRLVGSGNNVTVTARDAAKARNLTAELQKFAKKEAAVKSVPYGQATSDDLVVLAVPYPADVEIVKEYGAKLGGKTLIDICTPLNASDDGLVTVPNTSAAEEVAKAAPAGSKVIKAFATNFSRTLAAGEVAGQPLDVFVAGNDAGAKQIVGQLIEAGGLRPLDVGPLERARQLEGLHLINVVVQASMEHPWLTAIKFIG